MSDPRVHYLSTLAFDDDWLARLSAAFPHVVVEQVGAEHADQVPAEVWARTDVLHTHAAVPPPHLAPRLRWVQLDTSGVDHLRGTPLWASPAELTTLGGISPVPLAEYVLFMVLGHAHRMTAMRDVGATRAWPDPATRWQRFLPAPLAGATLAVLGYGRIGQAVGALARGHGMHVLGVTRTGVAATPSRRAQQYARSGGAAVLSDQDPDTQVVGPDQLLEVLARSDYVVVVVPLTDATRGLVDAEAVAAMKPGAVLINVARGGVVDEDALLAALRSGHLAGASLDVFADEPLPPTSPWWSEPSVVVTPHVAGLAGDYHAHVERLVTENLRRFCAGKPLLNRVDREAGY